MFKKILIANRGEIALRIIDTLRRLNIKSIAVYDDRELKTKYVSAADEAYSLGTGRLKDTFLNIDKVLQIAKDSGADAIHPGYGFLSENPVFAARCADLGIEFIGPEPESIQRMGNKLQALDVAKEAQVPTIPAIQGSIEEIINSADDSFFPCLIKAAAGGGGKAMHRADKQGDLAILLNKASNEAMKYFGNGEVYVEKYIESPRHIEIQLLGDKHNNIIHLYERECSIQRRYQKIIEESPSISISNELRTKLINDAIKIAKAVSYQGAGTIEFLVDSDGTYYFLEMNTRIQVEHPVSEEITSLDIVEEQIKIAAGEKIDYSFPILNPTAHAIEVRLYAEDPQQEFKPSPGEVFFSNLDKLKEVRVDTNLKSGDIIFSDFDPMLAKIIAKGATREEAIAKIIRAVEMIRIHGIKTNKHFLSSLLSNDNFQRNRISTAFLDSGSFSPVLSKSPSGDVLSLYALASLYLSMQYHPELSVRRHRLINEIGFWRTELTVQVSLNEERYHFQQIKITGYHVAAFLKDHIISIQVRALDDNSIKFTHNNNYYELSYSWNNVEHVLYLSDLNHEFTFERNDWLRPSQIATKTIAENTKGNSNHLRSPLSGQVLRINYKEGDELASGESVLVIESMKMENDIKIADSVVLKKLHVSEGEQVREGDLLAELDH